MQSKSIIHGWIGDLQEALKNETVSVCDLRIGVFYTAVRLSDGHAGVAFTPRG